MPDISAVSSNGLSSYWAFEHKFAPSTKLPLPLSIAQGKNWRWLRERVGVRAKILILLCMMLLASCSHVRKDGPPNFYVDETKIPNAVPRAEPLAKYGNMNSYTVFGKRYYTMHSSKHYNQVGTASWYGTKWHGRRTSSGERYNILAMTAAHRTLPLPTYVEVTNLRNHKKVIVKVNDRGPYTNDTNRIIDLSYVAAKKLGMVGHGTSYVRVKAIDPYIYNRRPIYASNAYKPFTAAKTSNRSSQAEYYLQVGAFRSKQNAERRKRQIASLFSAPVNVAKPSMRNQLYRVQIGPIRDVTTANRISRRLHVLGIKTNKQYGA